MLTADQCITAAALPADSPHYAEGLPPKFVIAWKSRTSVFLGKLAQHEFHSVDFGDLVDLNIRG